MPFHLRVVKTFVEYAFSYHAGGAGYYGFYCHNED